MQELSHVKHVLDEIRGVGAQNMNTNLAYEAAYAYRVLSSTVEGETAKQYCHELYNALDGVHNRVDFNTYPDLLIYRNADVVVEIPEKLSFGMWIFSHCIEFALMCMLPVQVIGMKRVLVTTPILVGFFCVSLFVLVHDFQRFSKEREIMSRDPEDRIRRGLCMIYRLYGVKLLSSETDTIRSVVKKFKYDRQFFLMLALAEELYNKEVRV